MSKTKKDTFFNVLRKQEREYEDRNRFTSEEYIHHKKEKKMKNALRSNNIYDLTAIDEYDYL
jgi:hypothetical protein